MDRNGFGFGGSVNGNGVPFNTTPPHPLYSHVQSSQPNITSNATSIDHRHPPLPETLSSFYDHPHPHPLPPFQNIPILMDSSSFMNQPSVIQAPSFPSMDNSEFETNPSKIKRRSRSFTDLMEIKQYPIYFYPYPHPTLLNQPKVNESSPLDSSPSSPSVVNGKIAIRRAPDFLLGKPVHIVTKEEKKIAHSAMERKYRKELNLQIKKLREIVPTCSEKTGINLHKVEILKLTSEYIRQLKLAEAEETERLQKESHNLPIDNHMDENQTELQLKIREQQQLIEQQQQLIQHLTREKIRLNHSLLKGRKSVHVDDFDVNSLIDSYAGTGFDEQRT